MNSRPDQQNVLPDPFSSVRSHRFQTAEKLMLLKENTVPRDHVAARPPARNANRADKPTNGPRRRILVIGAVIGVLGLFSVSGTGCMPLPTRIPTMLMSPVTRTR